MDATGANPWQPSGVEASVTGTLLARITIRVMTSSSQAVHPPFRPAAVIIR
jgi:hypothetical protein